MLACNHRGLRQCNLSRHEGSSCRSHLSAKYGKSALWMDHVVLSLRTVARMNREHSMRASDIHMMHEHSQLAMMSAALEVGPCTVVVTKLLMICECEYKILFLFMRTAAWFLTAIPLTIIILNLSVGLTGPPPVQRHVRLATSSFRRILMLHPPALPTPTSVPPPPLPVAMDSSAPLEICNGTEHTELWGALVLAGPENEQSTAAACCKSCHAYEPVFDVLQGSPCNAWVWSPLSKHCWLKHQKPEELKHAVRLLSDPDRRRDTKVVWQSGVVLEPKPCVDCIVPTAFTGCISKDRCNTSRACGSPAIDGYSHVKPKCIEASPTARLYHRLLEVGTRLVAFAEPHADYDGLGVKWGIGHKKQRWEDCEAACRAFIPGHHGPFAGLPCNVWTWCSLPVCFEPDAHSHSFGDCWLKFTELPEAPEVNMRSPGMRPSFIQRHRRQLAAGVSWYSGALLPPGVNMTTGTWGPRAFW